MTTERGLSESAAWAAPREGDDPGALAESVEKTPPDLTATDRHGLGER